MDRKAVKRAQLFYNRLTLPAYDLWVHGLSNPLAWRCPTDDLLEWCNRHITANHLDVGVGSGFLLDRAHFRRHYPRIVLMDLNPQTLNWSARRIARYHPDTHRSNLLEPIDYDGPRFESIGMNYVLHCLPGSRKEKAAVFDHLAMLLEPGGVIFGATIVPGGRPNPLARGLMEAYNLLGIFHNRHDSEAWLRQALENRFSRVEIERRGQVVLFAARS
jgi:SAM-dependent methyltransferase